MVIIMKMYIHLFTFLLSRYYWQSNRDCNGVNFLYFSVFASDYKTVFNKL